MNAGVPDLSSRKKGFLKKFEKLRFFKKLDNLSFS